MPPNLTRLKALIYTRTAEVFDLLVDQLLRCGCDTCAIRADPGGDFARLLDPALDVILVELEPGRENLSGLFMLLEQRGLEIPVILILDAADPALEAMALHYLDQGAADYLVKDRLGRLGAALERALEQRDFRRDFLPCGVRLPNTRGAQNGRDELPRYQKLFEHVPEIIREIRERRTPDHLLDKIFANLDEVVMVQDSVSRVILQCSPSIEKVLGYTSEEVVGKPPEFLFEKPEDFWEFGRQMRDALDQGIVLHRERRLRRKDGRYIFADATISAIWDEKGQRIANVGTIHDITERKQAEAALQENAALLKERNEELAESEERFRTLIEKAPVAISIARDGRRIYANPRYLKLFGYERPEEFIGRPLSNQVAVEDRQRIMDLNQQLVQGQRSEVEFEFTALRKDGSCFPAQGAVTCAEFSDGPAVLGFFYDLTGRKQAEAALRESEARYRRLFEDAVLGVFQSTPEGGVIAVNPSFARMFGYDSPEDVKATVKNVATDIFADPQRRSQIARQSAESPGTNVFENVYRRKDGSTFPGMLYLHPVLNEDGSVHHFEGLIEDITQRKAAERELKRRMVELEALHDVAVAGSEATSLDDLILRVVEIIKTQLYPDEFGVAFVDEELGTLTYHPSAYAYAEDIVLTIPVTTGISGAVARSGIPRRVGNVQLDSDYIAANPQTRSQLTVPMALGSRVIGVINAESYRPDYFSEADERLLVALAGELATAIEKIRLLEAERDRRQELESLAEISAVVRAAETRAEMLPAILDRMLEVLNSKGAAIAMRDPYSDELVFELGRGSWQAIQGKRMPLTAGIGGQVVASGKLISVDQSAGPDPRIFLPNFIGAARFVLCLPLIANEQVTGLLYLGCSSAFHPAEIRLANATADIIASAFRRVQLHAETVRQIQRLTALRAIDQSILETPDLEKTLHILLDKFTGLLGVDGAEFLLYDPRARRLEVAAECGLPPIPIWDKTLVLESTHAGRVALSGKIDFIPNLAAIEDSLTRRIRAIGERFTSYLCMPLIAKGELKGVMQIFNRTRLDPTPDWMGFLQTLTDQAAIAIDNAQLFNEQQRTNQRLTEAYDATIEGWSRALDMRDKDTEGHSQRVTELTLRLAWSLGVPEEELAHIRRGAQLHDIGKMGIPDAILLKPAPLTKDEWQIMRQHPQLALDFLSPIEFLRPALEIPYCHHERWDGSGYPRGLKGEEIPLSARIFAVVDVWDALTSDRPYRPAWSKEKALAYIRAQAGSHLDPRVVEHFLAALE